MSKYGLIYIVSNSEQKKNLFKIGKTSRTIESRIKELNSATGTLGKFKAHATFLVEDIDEVEKLIHKKLSKLRYQKNREFFESNYTELLIKVDELIGNDCLKKNIITELDKKTVKKIQDNKNKLEKEFISSDIDMDSMLEESIEKTINEKNTIDEDAERIGDYKNRFSNAQKKIYKTNIDKLKKTLKKYPFIHFHLAEEDGASRCEVVFSPNDKEEIKKSSLHHDKFNTPYKSDWGAINIDFFNFGGSVMVEQKERHYKWKDQYNTDYNPGNHIYNLNKVFKYLVQDFAKSIVNHKDLQLEEKKLSKKFDKKKELTESDYRYFIDRSFGQFHPPYTDDNEDGYRFTHTDCNEDHAFNLFLKHNKLSLKKKSVKIVNR